MLRATTYCAFILLSIGIFVLSAISLSEIVFRDRFFSCDREFSRKVATALIEGRNVAFATNDFPDKCVVAAVLAEMPATPDTIAIGSSRTMQLSRDLFDGSFYNASVFAARMYDYLGLIHLMEVHQRLPKQLIVGVDIWSIDEYDDDPRWGGMAFNAAVLMLRDAQAGEDRQPVARFRFATLLISYVRAAFKRLGGHMGVGELGQLFSLVRGCGCLNPFAAGAEILDFATSDFLTKRPDGSVIYEKTLREQDRSVVDRNGLLAARSYIATHHTLSQQGIAELWQLLLRLRRKGVEPIIWLAPFAPAEYELMSSSPNGKIILDSERELQKGARERGIRIVGSYNPANIPCTQSEFIDWQHPDKNCVARAFGRR